VSVNEFRYCGYQWISVLTLSDGPATPKFIIEPSTAVAVQHSDVAHRAHHSGGDCILIMFDLGWAGFWRKLLKEIVDDVPPDMVVCECTCRKLQCTGVNACERRLRFAEGKEQVSRSAEAQGCKGERGGPSPLLPE